MLIPSPATKKAQAIAKLRMKAVQRFLEQKSLIGSRQAARAVGRSPITLWRWQRAFAAHGLAGLEPRFTNSGRRSAVASVHFSAKAIRAMEGFILENGSMQRAWRKFASCRHCPAAVARMGYKSVPAPLARLVKITPLQQGCKAYVSADGKRLLLKIRGKDLQP